MSCSKESFSSPGGPIRIDVYSPATSGKHAAVLILHGTAGMEVPFGGDIVSFAEALNKRGVAATIPHYFESTHTSPGDEAFNSIFVHLPAWKTACSAALAFMAADARFDATRLGAIGFSLGAHIALSLAMAQPAGTSFKGVVDFFGPTLEPPLQGNWSVLPPLLIHHGTEDKLSIEDSRRVVRNLEAAVTGRTVIHSIFGKPVHGPAAGDQFIEYPAQGHGFTGPALAASRDSTVEFLDTHL
jgi:dienelactone hydrolase